MRARTNAQGQVVEEFVRLRHEETRGWFPGPHGLVPWEHAVWFTNHLREPGKPLRKLTFLRNVEQAWQLCQPIPESRQWVVFCQEPHNPCEYRLLVFDDTHIVRQLRSRGWRRQPATSAALFSRRKIESSFYSRPGVSKSTTL